MIRLLVLDVDGTMTDGGVYYDATGNEMKKFAIKDGAGLVLARTAGIRVMICTGRQSEAVRRRAADLKITDVYQNVGQKAVFLQAFMAENGYTRAQTAYCGDDLNDLAAMALCGFVAIAVFGLHPILVVVCAAAYGLFVRGRVVKAVDARKNRKGGDEA